MIVTAKKKIARVSFGKKSKSWLEKEENYTILLRTGFLYFIRFKICFYLSGDIYMYFQYLIRLIFVRGKKPVAM